MTGTVPVYKLHGSLNWSISGETIIIYQDMRPAFRHGGNAAIVPPIPEKQTPIWLEAVWDEAEQALRRSDVWVVCGYSAPEYDVEVLNLLRSGGSGRALKVLLLGPDSKDRVHHWSTIVPDAKIIPLLGLPLGIPAVADCLASELE
jgi:hypothetical protein